MKLKENKLLLFDFLAILITVYSFFLGYNYSIYNNDFHHWSYILSSYFDYKNNLKLFKEIFLQYGPGQIIFFYLLDYFTKINLVSIGIISSVIYSINLFLLYKILSIISSKKISLIIILLLFIIHPFSIYPWPDYFSGFCINLFVYFFLKEKQTKSFIIIGAFFLFLAVFFRSTYLFSIISAIIIYLIFSLYKKKKILFTKNIIFFLIILFSYFIILLNYNNLTNWYSQSIGVIANYSYGSDSPYMNKIIDYWGSNIWLILKFIKMGFRWFFSIFNIFKINNIIFTIFFLINFIFILKKIKYNIFFFEQKIIFISLLGLCGFIQSFMIYEVFRNINASAGIFICGAYVINNNNIKEFFKKNILLGLFLKLFTIIIIIKLAIGFPNNSTFLKYEDYKKQEYTKLNISFFSDRKMININTFEYYKNLEEVLCKKSSKIVNLTGDFALSYLCVNNIKNTISPAMQMMIMNPKEYERIFIKKELLHNEILISNEKMDYKNLILIYEIKNPHDPMPWYGANKYIYKLKN